MTSFHRMPKLTVFGCIAAIAACGGASSPALVVAPIAPAASASSSPSAASTVSVDRADLRSSIAYAIRLLETQRCRELLVEFVAPQDRPRFEQDGGFEKILPEFEKDKAPELLEVLRKLKSIEPRMEGERAIFDLSGGSAITWVRDGGRWYILN